MEVEPGLAKMLKPHQCWGIKFLWDAVFESSADVKAGRTPGGAILAHCMGLGKTLQTISLIHTVMSNFQVCLLTQSSSVCFLSDTWQHRRGPRGTRIHMEPRKQVGFQQTYNQCLHQFVLSLFVDLHTLHGTFDGSLYLCSSGSNATHETGTRELLGGMEENSV